MLQLLQSLWSTIKIFAFAFVKLVDTVPVLGGLLIISIAVGLYTFFKKTVKYNLMPPYGAAFYVLNLNFVTAIGNSSISDAHTQEPFPLSVSHINGNPPMPSNRLAIVVSAPQQSVSFWRT